MAALLACTACWRASAAVEGRVVEVEHDVADGREVDLVVHLRHFEVPGADGAGVLERQIALVGDVAGDRRDEEAGIVLGVAHGDLLRHGSVVVDEARIGADRVLGVAGADIGR